MVELIKMHGLGNDFICLDHFLFPTEEDYPTLARQLCHRQFGVGADGLLVILPSHLADARMRIFNPDGSEPEMCGNGIRCFAKYIYDRGYVQKERMVVETLAGLLTLDVQTEEEHVRTVRVNMGLPRLRPEEIPVLVAADQVMDAKLEVSGQEFRFTAVSMGNPHCVIFVPDFRDLDFEHLGPRIESHPLFPRKTNVEFVRVMSPSELEVLVWERGAGPTLACGTGACASVVAAGLEGRTGRTVTVHLPGGNLEIEWCENNEVMMTGPAAYVFHATLVDGHRDLIK